MVGPCPPPTLQPNLQAYLRQLGALLHQQQRQREDALTTRSAGSGSSSAGISDSSALAEGSRVSVTVHEHVQGDLSAGAWSDGMRVSMANKGGTRGWKLCATGFVLPTPDSCTE